ncbi:MAG: hypothetical protein R6U42_00580, partial [Halomonas sp.]
MHLFHKNLNAIILTALVAVAPQASAMASEDQTRIAQDIIRTLDAYAVYEMPSSIISSKIRLTSTSSSMMRALDALS